MAYVKKLFDDNFLYYASYVIKDRAIPELDDGLKPVQRRIIHTLLEADDGKFHKVANIVGSAMKYHPHGDASIYSALVVLANKDLFIDKQGNYGNMYTGDCASAARYIECRISPFAKQVFYNPKITQYEDSYDGRNKEPVVFPAKIPVVLLTGAEGIAVGMSTKILPHNPVEVLKAEISCLQGKSFKLYPDFPTAGVLDVSEYADGLGKVRVRASLDTSDPKKIVIRDLPFGVTTESLMDSVEAAAKAGRLKIASISDFTSDKVEIEVKLARGVYAQETIDALYAFTQCEQSISCNLLVIKDGNPCLMTVTDVVKHQSKRLLSILKAELDLQIKELLDEIHARTLERIFIEERVYKAIETKKTAAAVMKAVFDGLAKFANEIKREVTEEDIERLLRIPIRRISLYDIEKAKAEMDKLLATLKVAKHNLKHIVDYAIGVLNSYIKTLEPNWNRKTKIMSFDKVNVKEAAKRDVPLRYDKQNGYLGTSVSSGDHLYDVSPYDKILILRRSGIYDVVNVPERLFVDKNMLYSAIAEKDSISQVTFSIVYIDPSNGYLYIKRCKIEQWIMNKDYALVPEGSTVIFFTTEDKKSFTVKYAPKPRCKIDIEHFKVESFLVKGLKANGVRMSTRNAISALGEGEMGLFPDFAQGNIVVPSVSIKPKTEKATKEKNTTKKASKEKTVKASTKKTASKTTKKTTKASTKKPTKKTSEVKSSTSTKTTKTKASLLEIASKKKKK